MFISADVFIASLKPWAMYSFIDPRVHSTIPHYFVIINQDASTAPILVFPVATTQIEKRKKFYQHSWVNSECLVEVWPSECNLLSRESAFDCNSAIDLEIERFYEKFVTQDLEYIWLVPATILEKLRHGVRSSRNIEKWIKDLV